MKIFWSWQSDNHQPSGRYFVREVLGELASELNEVDAPEDAERPEHESLDGAENTERGDIHVDHDTLGVGGSPPIADTILGKIRDSAVFVADVTPVGATSSGKRLPNPNVMIELGYAVKVLGHERIVLVMNLAEDAALRHLPFDLRHWRAPATYKLHRDATEERRVEVAVALKQELRDRIVPSLKAAASLRSAAKRQVERAPQMSIALSHKMSSPICISQVLTELGIKSLDDVKMETPIRDKGSRAAAASPFDALRMSGPSLVGQAVSKPFSRWSDEEVDGYNSFVRVYYREYEKYVGEYEEFRRQQLRSIVVHLALRNTGTLPATGIDVEVRFPEEVMIYELEGGPKPPTPPEPPPFMPLARGQGYSRILPMESSDWARTNRRPSIFIDTEARSIHCRFDDLKHNHQMLIDPFIASFCTSEDIRTFDATYVITANEPIDPIRGSVRFDIEFVHSV